MTEGVLTTRELNRALLARQLLLERSKLPLTRALEQVAGLQTQYAPSAYIRLWSSLERFELADLTRALERKRAVQATLMRSTIHVVSARDFWLFSAGVGPSRQEWWLRTNRRVVGNADVDLDAVAARLRTELAGRTWHRKEIDAALRAHGGSVWSGAWVELVRVPPSGTWERRRADLFRLASEWLGPSEATEEQGIAHLLRRYLQGFGPARLLDAADWAGIPTAKIRAAAERLRSELAGRTWHRKEIDAALRTHGGSVWSGAWVELVRVPPSGTWERRRADLFRLASEWLGPSAATEEQGIAHLLRRYLQGFGPARLLDAADWAGIPTAKIRAAAERLRLRAFHDEDGRELLDLPRAPLPGDVPAPVRFLPTWDATLLVHARRTQILPEEYRPQIFSTKTPHSFATFLVDGAVAGRWRVERAKEKATLLLDSFAPLPRAAERQLRDEGGRLVRFHEPDALSYAVRRGESG